MEIKSQKKEKRITRGNNSSRYFGFLFHAVLARTSCDGYSSIERAVPHEPFAAAICKQTHTDAKAEPQTRTLGLRGGERSLRSAPFSVVRPVHANSMFVRKATGTAQ
ncbi:Hypothetical protein NTJ_12948 [Nesidiocoris tenuis]|uniref:Uncharacterized protein n=1 Tax=Nesidiocoris tenuis TaxID=355587 RepID=A0ABN7B6V3_9HEMI|nr:Hypothetical protein NTJ_12948 [Nesidiocoris tenuis]